MPMRGGATGTPRLEQTGVNPASRHLRHIGGVFAFPASRTARTRYLPPNAEVLRPESVASLAFLPEGNLEKLL